jgi:hypothetical protein
MKWWRAFARSSKTTPVRASELAGEPRDSEPAHFFDEPLPIFLDQEPFPSAATFTAG